ncbi:hypothetical protein HPB48_018000 [Haemaphysalis longicornis]|uniref:Uncharacterized protein n=1 Tax=Haemaphysalis longicornis TaxID=44386 RepID=A0A9J6FK70_HAELO|nr:hypothetical protein HPB48_018000 [Haemaphysalis longicornis]
MPRGEATTPPAPLKAGMASARTPTDDPIASLSPPSNPPEGIMEGNDTDTTSPATTETDEEISSPWIEVVRRSHRRRTPPQYKPAPKSPLTLALRHRPSTHQPRQRPLPADDFKIGIRPRNGLQLSRADPISHCVEIGFAYFNSTFPAPHWRGAERHSRQHTIFSSSANAREPSEAYTNIAQEHHLEYVKSLITAPGYEVLTARRLGESKAFVTTFRGKRVPYYVYINQALLRCYPPHGRPFARSLIKWATERTFTPRLPPRPNYDGEPNPTLDRYILISEVRAALTRLRKNTAPRPGGISNRLLANLDDDSLMSLTACLNRVWREGKIPAEWKLADQTPQPPSLRPGQSTLYSFPLPAPSNT